MTDRSNLTARVEETDSPDPSGGAARLLELFRDGGVAELTRGVLDYIALDTRIPLEWVVPSGTLQAGGVAVTIKTDTSEAVWRCGGHGEAAVQDDFVETVTADSTVWDVGANIGSYALLAAAVGADVVAFEPGPRARAALVENARRNDASSQINATPYALADYDGAGMLLPAERTGVRELAADSDVGDAVPVRRGASVDAPAPDVIKIDVEGAEVAVLDGLAGLLNETAAVYVEIHDGVDTADVTARLRDAGLEIGARWGGGDENPIVKGER